MKVDQQRGQVALAITIFALAISLAMGLGLGGPVIKEIQNTRNTFSSRQSFFAAESGVEDAVYRLKNGLSVANTFSLNVGEAEADISLTDVTGGKEISAAGDWRNLVRRLLASVQVGDGISFNYGVQVGAGGFELENNAGVNGNVYTNGSIDGENGSYITNTAIAASSAALAANQSNSTPTTPANYIRFRNSAGAQDLAQSFTVSSDEPINKARFYIRKTGNPGSATVKLVTGSGGLPSTNVLTSATLSSSQVTNAYGWVDAVFSSSPLLDQGTTYWLVIDSSSNSTSHYYEMAANDDYSAGVGKLGALGGSWSDTSPAGLDSYFEIYLGGLSGTINNVDIGTGGTGDAYAHTVTNSTVTGSLYCQTGSGNNKACNTSRADPSPQPFPVSDGNIAAWKEDAAAGGTLTGDYNVSGATATLGPKKIEGNLTLSNNAILTLTGTVWVTGNISMSNNADIILDSAYGEASGILVTDGRLDVSNNGTFAGSGDPDSYLMVVSTSDCPASAACGGNNAMRIANNAGTVILNAQKGTISFADNSGTKSVVAYKIKMENNSVVNYDQGLASQYFTNGPAGGFNIGSWGEVE